MAINLAKKASDRVAERFKLASCTEGLFSERYKWTGVDTVQIYSVDTLTLNSYDKTLTGGSRFGALTELGDSIQELTVTDDKSFNGAIDKGNNTSQMLVKSAASVLRRQTDEVIIPYVDKYRLGKFSAQAGLVYTVTTTPTSGDIIETMLKAGAAMSNELVPKNDRVIYVGESLAIKVKLASQVIGVDKLGEKVLVNGVIGTLDGAQVRVVPDSYMPTAAEFMIVRKGAAVAPKKIETYRVLEQHPDIDGAVVQGRLLHDCFVLNANCRAVLVCETKAAGSGGGYTYKKVLATSGNPSSSGWYTRSTTAMTASTASVMASGTTYYEKLT